MNASGPRAWSWTIFITTFVVFGIVGTVWNLAQPPLSGADEPEHLYHAEAVWSGQWVPPLAPALFPAAQFEASKVVIPQPTMDQCFEGNSAVPASCAHGRIIHGPAPTRVNATTAGREPPLPAVLTGLPFAVSPTGTGLYLSRFLDTLVGAGALAIALTLALARRRVVLSVGILVATTPSVVAGWGVLGTSQLEVGAATVVWTCVALIASSDRVERSLVILTSVAATLLVLSRPISFAYLALAALALVVLAPWSRLRSLWAERHTRVCLGAVAAATVVALGWYVFAEAPANPSYLSVSHLPHITSLQQRLSVSIGQARNYWLQVVGATGYNEYNGPWWMTLLWTGLVAFMVGAGVLFARVRRVVVVALLFVVLLALPVVAQAVSMPKLYLYWQGRYDLPTLTGIILVAVGGLDSRVAASREFRRALLPVVALVAGLQVLELAGTLRRYVVGIGGNLNPFHWAHGWSPPLPGLALLIVGAVAVAVAYATVLFHQYKALGPPAHQLSEAGPQPATTLAGPG